VGAVVAEQRKLRKKQLRKKQKNKRENEIRF